MRHALLCGCFGAEVARSKDEELPGDKRKCSEAAAAAETVTSTAHSTSWGASSRLERGFEHVGSETVLGNVPEDDCLSTSEQYSGRSGGTGMRNAARTRGEPSAAAGHNRDAEVNNPQLVSSENVEPVAAAEASSRPSIDAQSPLQPYQAPQEATRPPATGSRVRAVSGPLRPTGGSMEAMGVGVAPLHRSHEATVRRLNAAIEEFGKEKPGYDLVGVAQAMVGFEKMVLEEAQRVRYNSIRLQAIEMRPESASIYMNMEKEDWNALNSMQPPAARKSTSLNKRSAAEHTSSYNDGSRPTL